MTTDIRDRKDMKTYTYEERIKVVAESSKTFNELMERTNSIIEEILKEDDSLFCTNKRWVYYGTWKVTLFVNEYRFGAELAEKLRKVSVITHDEDKEFEISYLEEEIRECVEEYAYSLF